jgi:hypothetical protein
MASEFFKPAIAKHEAKKAAQAEEAAKAEQQPPALPTPDETTG